MKTDRQNHRGQRAAQAATGLLELRPFYWILPLVPLALYLYFVLAEMPPGSSGQFEALTAISITHTVLHATAPFITAHRKWLIPYFVVQGALAFSMAMMLSSQMYVYALYLALAGQAASLFDNVRSATITVLAYVLLSGVNFVLRMGWDNLPMFFIWTVPMTFFIIVYVAMYIRQAKARQEAQTLLTDLETAHRQLAEYAVQVESLTLSHERERMARELHDTLVQGLAGLILQLEAADTHLSRGQVERAQKITVQAMARARATLADARHAIDDLHNTDANLDIESATRAEAERFVSATGIACDLDLEVTSRVPDSVAEQVLKILSEGLTNIARHARAKHVRLRLEAHKDLVEMEIRDDGSGFDASEQVSSGHYGLVGMRERARLAGGTLEICSQPGEGTTLKLKLPLRERNVLT